MRRSLVISGPVRLWAGAALSRCGGSFGGSQVLELVLTRGQRARVELVLKEIREDER